MKELLELLGTKEPYYAQFLFMLPFQNTSSLKPDDATDLLQERVLGRCGEISQGFTIFRMKGSPCRGMKRVERHGANVKELVVCRLGRLQSSVSSFTWGTL